MKQTGPKAKDLLVVNKHLGRLTSFFSKVKLKKKKAFSEIDKIKKKYTGIKK